MHFSLAQHRQQFAAAILRWAGGKLAPGAPAREHAFTRKRFGRRFPQRAPGTARPAAEAAE